MHWYIHIYIGINHKNKLYLIHTFLTTTNCFPICFCCCFFLVYLFIISLLRKLCTNQTTEETPLYRYVQFKQAVIFQAAYDISILTFILSTFCTFIWWKLYHIIISKWKNYILLATVNKHLAKASHLLKASTPVTYYMVMKCSKCQHQWFITS